MSEEQQVLDENAANINDENQMQAEDMEGDPEQQEIMDMEGMQGDSQ